MAESPCASDCQIPAFGSPLPASGPSLPASGAPAPVTARTVVGDLQPLAGPLDWWLRLPCPRSAAESDAVFRQAVPSHSEEAWWYLAGPLNRGKRLPDM